MRRRHIQPDQLELFVPPQWPCPLQTPQWQNLPRRTRSEVTSLVARLLMKHGRRERNSTPVETIEAIRQLTLIANDDLIAGILNRNGLRTGNGNRWTRERVCSLRSHRKIPPFQATANGVEPWLNLTKASALLDITQKTLRLAVIAGDIGALHPLPDGPWLFKRSDLQGMPGQSIAERAKNRRKHPMGQSTEQQNLFASTA
ncbi:MAG: hypothetical protein O3B08_02770 [Proteobacteria bacterium]|nr:hypothetical protein [Pseudomonadota bacterium]